MTVTGIASGMDQNAHERTYVGFLTLFKWGTVIAIAVTAFVVALLAS